MFCSPMEFRIFEQCYSRLVVTQNHSMPIVRKTNALEKSTCSQIASVVASVKATNSPLVVDLELD